MKVTHINQTDAPRPKPFARLRGEMKAQNISREYLGRHLNRSISHMNSLFTRTAPWDLREAYATMDMLRLPHDELHIYFPKEG